MNNIHIYLRYGAKLAKGAKVLVTKPAGLISILPAAAVTLTTPQKAIILLAILFILDFITGIGASWVEFRKTKTVVPGSGKRYLIQSSKLRLSAVKFVTYGLVILIAHGLEWTFAIKEFELHPKFQKMTLTTIAIAFCCGIEIYSILFENIKRMGFDIIEKIKTISKSGWDLYKTIKNGNSKTEG